MMNWMKRMFLMGAMLMVMMSFAAPAMADDLNELATPNDYYSNLWNTVSDGIPPEAGAPSKPGPRKDCIDYWFWGSTGWYHICL
jgi:hypothetical protein